MYGMFAAFAPPNEKNGPYSHGSTGRSKGPSVGHFFTSGRAIVCWIGCQPTFLNSATMAMGM